MKNYNNYYASNGLEWMVLSARNFQEAFDEARMHLGVYLRKSDCRLATENEVAKFKEETAVNASPN